MKCRSEWQSPATVVRIRTSRGPGFCRLTSSITSGLLTSCRTAAFIGVSPFLLCILVVYSYSKHGKCAPSPIQLGFTRVGHIKLSKSDVSDFDRERVGVRGYGLSIGRNPSPGSQERSDLSPWER